MTEKQIKKAIVLDAVSELMNACKHVFYAHEKEYTADIDCTEIYDAYSELMKAENLKVMYEFE